MLHIFTVLGLSKQLLEVWGVSAMEMTDHSNVSDKYREPLPFRFLLTPGRRKTLADELIEIYAYVIQAPIRYLREQQY